MREPHELSKLFPPMSEAEIQELATDIKAHGLRVPIMLYERKVLDGVQRQRACEIAGVTPDYMSFESNPEHLVRGGALAYVVSENLLRRHLTLEQRKAKGVELVALIESELKKSNGNTSTCVEVISKRRGQPKSIKRVALKKAAALVKLHEETLRREIKKRKPYLKTRERSAKKFSKKINAAKNRREKLKAKAEWLRQGLTIKSAIRSLIDRAKDNGGMIYVELGGYGIRCSKICDRKVR